MAFLSPFYHPRRGAYWGLLVDLGAAPMKPTVSDSPLFGTSIVRGELPEESRGLGRHDIGGRASAFAGCSLGSLTDAIRLELSVWNFEHAMILAEEAEAVVNESEAVDTLLLPGIMILIARAHISYAETKQLEVERHIRRAKELLLRAKRLLGGEDEQIVEITALSASLEVSKKVPMSRWNSSKDESIPTQFARQQPGWLISKR